MQEQKIFIVTNKRLDSNKSVCRNTKKLGGDNTGG
jgi:hypothetical protein